MKIPAPPLNTKDLSPFTLKLKPTRGAHNNCPLGVRSVLYPGKNFSTFSLRRGLSLITGMSNLKP